MALRKSRELASGVTGDYWRVTSAAVDFLTDTSKIQMSMYLSKDARNAGKPPIVTHAFEFSGDDNPIKPAALRKGDIIALVYEKMKTVSDFSDATDE